MNLVIRQMEDKDAQDYKSYIDKFEHASLFVSLKYFELLKDFLGDKPLHLIAFDVNGKIQGVLPCFLRKTTLGNVINSLPFYGSNGGIFAEDEEVKKMLLVAFNNLCNCNNCISSTIVSSPLDTDKEVYLDNAKPDFIDERIGQLTNIGGCQTAEDLMDLYHYKTRNTIRKGMKADITIRWENGLDYINFLKETHEDNIRNIGGLPKPAAFFDKVVDNFEYGNDYKIYYCLLEGKPIAALLLFYYNKTVEYFTPVVVSEYRSMQVLSAVIYKAMSDALGEYKWWNWGGTWLSQDGVYLFKSRWGTTDHQYYYYTRLYNKDLLDKPRIFFIDNFPFYYVLPFNVLNSEKK